MNEPVKNNEASESLATLSECKVGLPLNDKNCLVLDKSDKQISFRHNITRNTLHIIEGSLSISEVSAKNFLFLFGDVVFKVDYLGGGEVAFISDNIHFSDLREDHDEHFGFLTIRFTISFESIVEMPRVASYQSLRLMELKPEEIINWSIDSAFSNSIVSNR